MAGGRAEVIVIGGGVAGTSCAYHLARGGTAVLLLERTALAAASSGRSAAFIETQYSEPDRIRMCVYGRNLYAELNDSYPLDFRVRGKLLLGRTADERRTFEASIALQRELGVDDSVILDHAELAARFAALRFDGDEFALYGPRDGYLDPVAPAHAYAAAAGEAGATVRPSSEVRAISHLGGGFTVRTDRETVAADAIVIAAGAWVDAVAEMIGLRLPVSGYRRQVALLAAPATETTPLFVDPNAPGGCLYFRDDGDGRLVAGFHSEHRDDPPVAPPDHDARAADPAHAAQVAELVRLRLGEHADAVHVIGGWAGLYPIADDGRFLLGESQHCPGVFVCGALAGNGIQLSGAAGAIVAQLIQHQTQSILPDLTQYAPDRFLPAGADQSRIA